MVYRNGTFMGTNHLPLYYQSWLPLQSPKAVVILVHGLGSHSGQFDSLVNSLVPLGYGLYGFDLRGHGRSPGRRGYIQTWAEFREDLRQFHQVITTRHPTLPVYGLGHSLGAIILLDYALQYPRALSGLITMAPALQPAGVPPLRLAIGRILSWVWPHFTLNAGIDQRAGSRDAAVILANAQDPCRHTKGTARLATEFFRTTRWIQAQLPLLQVPILILHGSDDRVAMPTGSQLLFDRLTIIDKEYRCYPGAYHDLHRDLDADQVIADLVNWLDRQGHQERVYCRLNYQTLYKTCLQ